MDSYLGIDVGGTKVAVGLVTSTGKVMDRLVCPTVKSDPEEFVRLVVGMVARLIGSDFRPRACGVAVPAYLNREYGVVKWCPNIPVLNNFPLGVELSKLLGIPVVLEYDGHALTLGEYWKGCGAGRRSMVFLSIGTGIGGGMILDGKLHRGVSGTAGAFGWMIIERNWLDHSKEECGNLEFEASGVAYKRKVALWEASLGCSCGAALDDSEAMLVASNQDNEADQADSPRKDVMTYLGMAVSTLVSVLNPEVVVIGGGFGVSLGQPFVELLTSMISRYSAPYAARVVEVCLSSLGVDAGIIGSAQSAMLLQNVEG
ncbi:MAG TPA: ROK family protein [Bacillota bacterium]|mgnify:CR=1 FL=1|nr:ROK family protein [Bacillota bacterium]